MTKRFDLHSIQESTEGDLEGLGLYLRQLEGEPFLFFRYTYGGELTIHFGTTIERKSPKLKNRARGSYVLSVRGSLWSLIVDHRIMVLSDLPKKLSVAESKKLSAIDVEKTPLMKPGTPLASAMPIRDEPSGGIGLYLNFSNQSRFMIRPEPTHVEEEANDPDTENLPEIADWEMYTPIDRYLQVGPGPRWAYLASTKRERSNSATQSHTPPRTKQELAAFLM